ncbi:uncharacterized protein A1O5_13421, partial [Cladophialophora psammophila CBS 110553]
FVQRGQNMAISGRYHSVGKLGSGSFSNVYLERNTETGNEVAIQLEHHSVAPSLLKEKVEIY